MDGYLRRIYDKEQRRAIKALFCRDEKFYVGNSAGVYLLTDGHCITFIPEKNFLLNPERFKTLPDTTIQKYTGENFIKGLKPVKLLEKAKILGGIYKPVKRICCYQCGNGELIWVDERFARRYRGCTARYFEEKTDAPPFTRLIVYTLYDRVVGIVLPVRVTEEA